MSLIDFEFAHALVEAIRDVLLSGYRVPAAVLESTFKELESVMPRLEVSIECRIHQLYGPINDSVLVGQWLGEPRAGKFGRQGAPRGQVDVLAHPPNSRGSIPGVASPP